MLPRRMRAIFILVVHLIRCNALAPPIKPSATPTVLPNSHETPKAPTSHHTNTNKSDILYPLAALRRNGTLAVDSVHSIYFEEYGNGQQHETVMMNTSSRNRVALSLHGGPGAGSFPRHAQFFDPEKYQRIILFDQRGCGRSTPRGETKFNTLRHLVEDIESLRTHLGIEKFDVILGGSWGSTLALAYAQSYADRVGSIVLRGVCLFRPQEIEWLFGDKEQNEMVKGQSNRKTFFISDRKELSKEWKTFQDAVKSCYKETENEIIEGRHNQRRRSVLHQYYNHLLGNDVISRAIAMKNWMMWEMKVSSISASVPKDLGETIVWDSAKKAWKMQSTNKTTVEQSLSNQDVNHHFRRWPERVPFVHSKFSPSLPRTVSKSPSLRPSANITEADAKKFIPAQAMLTCYFSANDVYMMSEFQLLKKENIDRIRHIPCIAIQGGNDNICPPDTALDLHKEWPEMELRIVTMGKHSMYDPPITSELIKATDRLAGV